MCNRYTQAYDDRLKKYWAKVAKQAEALADLIRRTTRVSPSDKLPLKVAACAEGEPQPIDMTWGFTLPDKLQINAKSETITTVGLFKAAAQERRCLLIVDGMFEWHEKTKAKHFFRLKGGEAFGVPCVYRPATGRLPQFVALTTEPNALVAEVKPRMSAMLDVEGGRAWLRPGPLGQDEINDLCRPFAPDKMEGWEVDRSIQEGPDAILPLGAGPRKMTAEKPSGEQLNLL
jgi:putative SOS response-associated peptidase YedK